MRRSRRSAPAGGRPLVVRLLRKTGDLHPDVPPSSDTLSGASSSALASRSACQLIDSAGCVFGEITSAKRERHANQL
jgi:hypothetical protein